MYYKTLILDDDNEFRLRSRFYYLRMKDCCYIFRSKISTVIELKKQWMRNTATVNTLLLHNSK